DSRLVILFDVEAFFTALLVLVGLAVVWFASTEATQAVPPEAGVVSTDISLLVRGFRELVNEPDYAVLAGEEARRHTLKHYGMEAFLTNWNRVLADVAR
ncbi:hypothetical protein ACFQ1S_45890, partial [Kibdelosporangium lantanae]